MIRHRQGHEARARGRSPQVGRADEPSSFAPLDPTLAQVRGRSPSAHRALAAWAQFRLSPGRPQVECTDPHGSAWTGQSRTLFRWLWPHRGSPAWEIPALDHRWENNRATRNGCSIEMMLIGAAQSRGSWFTLARNKPSGFKYKETPVAIVDKRRHLGEFHLRHVRLVVQADSRRTTFALCSPSSATDAFTSRTAAMLFRSGVAHFRLTHSGRPRRKGGELSTGSGRTLKPVGTTPDSSRSFM